MTSTEGKKKYLQSMLDPNFNIINETSCSFCLIFWHTFWVMVFVFFFVSVVAVSPSHCVFAAGGGRAQLMSLSAAGRA